ncbi:hypothetical protein ABTQ08_20250, partial [Acinetobacter baumannii]
VLIGGIAAIVVRVVTAMAAVVVAIAVPVGIGAIGVIAGRAASGRKAATMMAPRPNLPLPS